MPRLRYSLRALMLFLIVVCLIASNLYTSRELSRAKLKLQEAQRIVEKQRVELGRLDVADPTRLHVLALPTQENFTWKWRVHVPKGMSLFLAADKIPEGGLPGNYSTSQLPAGEYSLTAVMRPDHLGRWSFNASRGTAGSVGVVLSPEQSKWIVDEMGFSSSQAGNSGTESKPRGATMVLLRLRAMRDLGGGARSTAPEPSDGVMVWAVSH